jgi:glycerol kinase
MGVNPRFDLICLIRVNPRFVLICLIRVNPRFVLLCLMRVNPRLVLIRVDLRLCAAGVYSISVAYILALDQGTTSSRAILFDRDGAIVGIAQKEFAQIFPRPGWVEHDPQEIWATQLAVAVEALGRARIRAQDVAAIGITNQRETAIVWDRETGQPIANAIVWQDRRTADLCDRLRADGHQALVSERTGLVIDAYFSGTKIAWLLDNVPGARARAEAGKLAFGTVDSWLVWKLTGGKVHITDVSNASRTMLFNIDTLAWDDDLLSLLKIPAGMLPEARSSSEVYGHVSKDLGVSEVPIAGIAGDQQAALFGQMCVSPGLAKNTYGTGCFLLQNTGTRRVASQNKLLSTVAWQIGNRTEYALEGSVFIGGAVVQWLRDGLEMIGRSSEVETLAASVTDNGGVFLVPAFAGLGAPHWDAYARGLVIGITRGTTRGHLARAALESIAYQVDDLLEAVRRDSNITLSELRVDGGAASNDGLMQFQADVLGVPVVRPAVTETTALGAAYLAGLAVGFWSSLDEIGRQWKVERRFEPAMARADAERLRERWREAVSRAKGWIPAGSGT